MTADHDPNSQIPLSDRLRMIRGDFESVKPEPTQTEQVIETPEERERAEGWLQATSLLEKFHVSDFLTAYLNEAWNGNGVLLPIKKSFSRGREIVVGYQLSGFSKVTSNIQVFEVHYGPTIGSRRTGDFQDLSTSGWSTIRQGLLDKHHYMSILARRVDPLYWDTGFKIWANSYADPRGFANTAEPPEYHVRGDIQEVPVRSGWYRSGDLKDEDDITNFLARDYKKQLESGDLPTSSRSVNTHQEWISGTKFDKRIGEEIDKEYDVVRSGTVFLTEVRDILRKHGFIFYRLRRGLVSEVAVQEGRVLLELEAGRSPDETLREYSDALSVDIPGAKAIIGTTTSNIEVLKNYLLDKTHWDEFLRHQKPGTPFSIVSEADELWKKGDYSNRRTLEDLRIQPYSDLEKNGFSIKPDEYGYFRPWCERYMPLVIPAKIL